LIDAADEDENTNVRALLLLVQRELDAAAEAAEARGLHASIRCRAAETCDMDIRAPG